MPKVKYGLKNCFYAVATIGSDGTATYADPVRIPGAVSISLEPSGENSTFYADDMAYFVTGGNTGYSGDLTIAMIPDSFRKDCLGEVEAATGLLVEDADAAPKNFALMFEFTTDAKAQRHVFYNCTATRPNIAGQTKADSVEVSTETITITATSIVDANGKTITKGKADDNYANYDAWYTSVQQPTA